MQGIITLCGSVRFKELFEEANRLLTRADWIVLTVAEFDHAMLHDSTNKEGMLLKAQLDKLHRAKIDISQAILVLDKDKYVGESTLGEIEHAVERDKIVYFYSSGGLETLCG